MRVVLQLSFLFVTSLTGFAQARFLSDTMLAAHNSVRHKLGLTSLAWSDRLAARAQEWAESLLAKNQFHHQPKSPYGENLFEIIGARASPAQVVDYWASESRNYDYRSNRCNGTCGHYTQIVWRATTEVGCGMARGGDREVWVCEYNPPGNWAGQRPF